MGADMLVRRRKTQITVTSVPTIIEHLTSKNVPALPYEIMVLIATFAGLYSTVLATENLRSERASFVRKPSSDLWEHTLGMWHAQRQLSQLSMVSRTWHADLVSLVLARPVLRTPRAVRRLSRLICRWPHYGQYVREIVLFSPAATDEGMKALQTLLLCKEPGFIGTIFILDPDSTEKSHTTPSMISRVLSRMAPSRLSKRLNSVFFQTLHLGSRSAAAYTTLDRAGSMTFYGVHALAYFHEYPVTFAPYIPGVSVHHDHKFLKSLRLRNMSLKDVCWPSMPSLTRLSINSCKWDPCTLPNDIDAPLLDSLHIVGCHPSWSAVPQAPTLVLHIIPHIRRLRTLILDFDIYYLLLQDKDLAENFTQLEELGAHMAGNYSCAVWNDSILPPVVLSSLRIFWVSADHARDELLLERYPRRVFVVFDPTYASHALRGRSEWSSPSTYKYDEIRLAGRDAFWNAVSPELLLQAKEIANDHVIEWVANYDDSHLGQMQAIHDDLSRNPFQTFGIVVWWGSAVHWRYPTASSLSL